MKILITGAGGFIGKTLCQRLNNKFTITGISKKFEKKKYRIIKHNLKKKINIKETFDYIIHVAAEIPSKYNDQYIYHSNIKMTKNILKFADENGVFNLIYFSSMAVYDTNKKKNISEKTRLLKNLKNDYSKSKIESEKYIKNWVNKKKNNKALILRIPGIVGKDSHSNFISEIVKKIRDDKKIIIFNYNEKFNNIVHVNEIVKFIIKQLEIFKKKFLILNFGSKKAIKIKEVLELISKKFNYDIKKIENLKSNKNSFLINFKKALKYGFKPLTVKQSLLKYIKGL